MGSPRCNEDEIMMDIMVGHSIQIEVYQDRCGEVIYRGRVVMTNGGPIINDEEEVGYSQDFQLIGEMFEDIDADRLGQWLARMERK